LQAPNGQSHDKPEIVQIVALHEGGDSHALCLQLLASGWIIMHALCVAGFL